MKTLLVVSAGAMGFLFAVPGWADDVRLSSGGTISGIVRQETDMVTIEVIAGTVSVPAGQVVEIERKRHVLHDYYESLDRLGGAPDAKGLYELARWAHEKGLRRFASELSNRVLRQDKSHEGAHKLLGHDLRDGRWLSAEEAKAADGLVSFRGRWIPTAERERILRDEEDARRTAIERSEERRREADERRKAADAARTPERQETLVMGIGSVGEPYHRYYTRSRHGRGRGGHIRGFRGFTPRPGTTIRR